jgi:AraC family transcriptional regulator
MQPKLPAGTFYGKKHKHILVRGIRLTECLYSPALRIPRHSHEFPYFGLVLEGSYTETYGTRHRDCGPSTLLFHPADEQHEEHHDDVAVRIFNFEFPAEWHDRLPQRPAALHFPRCFHSGELFRLARRLYGEFQDEDDLAPLAIEGLTLEILAATCRQRGHAKESRAPLWLRRVKDLMHDQYTENLSLETIAHAVNVHPAHLCRAFRQHYRCTLGDYMRDLRIERARQYLANSNTPLSEIALAVGYSDQSHFATAFKRQTGITPSHFRKMLQNANRTQNAKQRQDRDVDSPVD